MSDSSRSDCFWEADPNHTVKHNGLVNHEGMHETNTYAFLIPVEFYVKIRMTSLTSLTALKSHKEVAKR